MTASPLVLVSSDPMSAIQAALESDPHLISRHSHRAYLKALRPFEVYRAGRPLTKTLVEGYLASIIHDYKPATVMQARAAIRWWARRVSDLLIDTASTPEQEALAERVGKHASRILTIRGVSGETLPPGRYLEPSDLAALLRVCDEDPEPAGHRDAALFSVAWGTGLRCSSLTGLTLADLIPGPEADSMDIKWHGKGRTEDTGYIHGGGYHRLQAWLAIRGDTPGPLFCRIHRGGHIFPEKSLCAQSMLELLERRQLPAGIAHLTWHDFRRTFLSNIIDATDDLSTAQRLAGHKSPVTTQRYDRRPEYRRRQAVRSAIDIPA